MSRRRAGPRQLNPRTRSAAWVLAVADRIQRISGLAHFRVETGHFRNTTSVVSHRSEGIERHDHPGNAQHGRDRNSRAEETGKLIGADDAANNHDGRQGG